MSWSCPFSSVQYESTFLIFFASCPPRLVGWLVAAVPLFFGAFVFCVPSLLSTLGFGVALRLPWITVPAYLQRTAVQTTTVVVGEVYWCVCLQDPGQNRPGEFSPPSTRAAWEGGEAVGWGLAVSSVVFFPLLVWFGVAGICLVLRPARGRKSSVLCELYRAGLRAYRCNEKQSSRVVDRRRARYAFGDFWFWTLGFVTEFANARMLLALLFFMGKHMRKVRNLGKIAVIDILQGSVGVKTRARTTALEHLHKFEIDENPSMKRLRGLRYRTTLTSYLELRNRKHEKLFGVVERRVLKSIEEFGNHSLLASIVDVEDNAATENVALGNDAITGRVSSVSRAIPAHVASECSPEVLTRHVDPLRSAEAFEGSCFLRTDSSDSLLSKLKLYGDDLKESNDYVQQCQDRQFQNNSVEPQSLPPAPEPLAPCRPSANPSELEAPVEQNNTMGQDDLNREKHTYQSTSSRLNKHQEARNENSPSATTRVPDTGPPKRSCMTKRLFDVPSPGELEEFFAKAELMEQRRFAARYNFDVVNDVPLQGRYQWVSLRP